MTQFQGRLIARETYFSFMKKYKLNKTEKINNTWRYKSNLQMRNEIYEYETNHEDIIDGLYYFNSQ